MWNRKSLSVLCIAASVACLSAAVAPIVIAAERSPSISQAKAEPAYTPIVIIEDELTLAADAAALLQTFEVDRIAIDDASPIAKSQSTIDNSRRASSVDVALRWLVNYDVERGVNSAESIYCKAGPPTTRAEGATTSHACLARSGPNEFAEYVPGHLMPAVPLFVVKNGWPVQIGFAQRC